MTSTHKPKVLFVTYGGGHAEIVASLMNHHDAGRTSPHVFALTTAARQLRDRGVAATTCADWVADLDITDHLPWAEELAADFADGNSTVDLRDTRAYLGVSMRDLVSDLGPERARSKYRAEGRRAFCPVGFMTQVLERARPDCLVTTCDVRMEQAAVLAARSLGTTSLLVEDLLGFAIAGEELSQPSLARPREQYPDVVCVMNDFVKRRLIRAGFPAECIHVTGQPALAEVARRPRRSAAAPTVAFFSAARSDIAEAHLSTVTGAARLSPDWRWVIRLHPSQRHEHPDPRSLPGNCEIDTAASAESLLERADAAVLFRSTVGVTALQNGIPIVTLAYGGLPNNLPFVEAGVPDASSPSELVERLTPIVTGAEPIPAAGVSMFENTKDSASNVWRVIVQAAQAAAAR